MQGEKREKRIIQEIQLKKPLIVVALDYIQFICSINASVDKLTEEVCKSFDSFLHFYFILFIYALTPYTHTHAHKIILHFLNMTYFVTFYQFVQLRKPDLHRGLF